MVFKKRYKKNIKKRHLVTFSHPDSIISDQFRMIRTNINFLTEKKEKRNILITSTENGEGKSTITANLAVSMAQQKEKVLLIDANLRDSNIHNIFKIENNTGLTNVLMKQVSIEEAVTHPGIGNLDILTSGTVSFNPVEIFANEQVKDLLEILVHTYDIVLVDSPSILEHTESRVLANHCDGVVLVINRGRTEIDSVIEARRVLELANGNLVGAIINEI